MQGNHVELGLWTSTEESLSFVCTYVPVLKIFYVAIRDRLVTRKETFIQESWARVLRHDRTTRDEVHTIENEDPERTNNSVVYEMEMPTYPPSAYSTASKYALSFESVRNEPGLEI